MPRFKLNRQQLHHLLDGETIEVEDDRYESPFIIEGSNPRWFPVEQILPTPEHMVAAHRDAGLTTDLEVWSNHTYEVIVIGRDVPGAMVHLSIKRFDRAPCNNWRHIQQMKNEIMGPHWEGVMLYPDEDRIVDDANQYHLFCVPERLPFGFHDGPSVTTDDEVDRYNAADHRGKQEPWQEGLTTGDVRHESDASHAVHDGRDAADDSDARQRREGYLGGSAPGPDRVEQER